MKDQNTVTSVAGDVIQTTVDTGKDTISYILNNPFVKTLGELLLAIVVVGVLLWLSRIIASFVKKKVIEYVHIQEQDVLDKIGALVMDLIFYTMAAFSIYFGFQIMGIDIGLIMGGFSIGVGFAFREILSNFISGILIFATKDYRIGYIVEIMDKQLPIFGRIEEINMRYIIIKTFELRRVVIPNTKFITANVKTYTAEDIIRKESHATVSVSSDLDFATTQLKEAVNQLDFINRKDLTDVLIESFDAHSVKLKITYVFDPNGQIAGHIVESRVNAAVLGVIKKYKFKLVPETVSSVEDDNIKNDDDNDDDDVVAAFS